MANNRKNGGSSLNRFFKELYLTDRFFIVLACLVLGLCLSFIFQSLFVIMQILVGVLAVLFIIDCIAVYRLDGIDATRDCPDRLSNGDENRISITVTNTYPYKVNVVIVEEIPFQFQKRDFTIEASIVSGESKVFEYDLRPTERGSYIFGRINVFVSGLFTLMHRRMIFSVDKPISVYPSFIEMHKYELLAASNRLTDYGVKKIRRLGNATEFDQIKQYTLGDDPRAINYKATARTNELMVNMYIDERSQPVYCIIDKGRTMQMPFNGMTLLDYAINSSLMLTSTALRKGDKAGMITFSSDIDDVLLASDKARQRNLVLDLLYSQKTNFKDANYEKLFSTTRRLIKQRSLILLFTNFETLNGLQRQLKYLRLIAKDHLVIVSFFLNSELDKILDENPDNVEDTFRKGTAEKLTSDKLLIVRELNRCGIHTILSSPETLTIDSINKYLEMKARGLI